MQVSRLQRELERMEAERDRAREDARRSTFIACIQDYVLSIFHDLHMQHARSPVHTHYHSSETQSKICHQLHVCLLMSKPNTLQVRRMSRHKAATVVQVVMKLPAEALQTMQFW